MRRSGLAIGFLIVPLAAPQVVFAQDDEGQSADEGPSEAERLSRLEGIVELDHEKLTTLEIDFDMKRNRFDELGIEISVPYRKILGSSQEDD